MLSVISQTVTSKASSPAGVQGCMVASSQLVHAYCLVHGPVIDWKEGSLVFMLNDAFVFDAPTPREEDAPICHGHITSLAVARTHRKLGIATRLMNAARG